MVPAPHITVTDHALQRYRERISAHASAEAIAAVLGGATVACAALFGARVVKIAPAGGRPGRIILGHVPGGVVVLTVLPLNEYLPQQLKPAERGGPMPIAQERALFLALEGTRP